VPKYHSFWLRIAGICGLMTPPIVLPLIAIAISRAPWFTWMENALSDLGVFEASALSFNTGLIMGGVMTFVFAIGLMKEFGKQILWRAGSSVFALDAVALGAIGVFTEAFGELHFYVSVAFFVLTPISLFLIGAAEIRGAKGKSLGVFTVLMGLVAALSWTFPRRGAAIPEIVSALAVSAWSMVLGYLLLKRDRAAASASPRLRSS